jgi:hypothetical protein
MPALKNPSLVVLDNASYHNVKTEDTGFPILVRKKLFSKTILHNTTLSIDFQTTQERQNYSSSGDSHHPLIWPETLNRSRQSNPHFWIYL